MLFYVDSSIVRISADLASILFGVVIVLQLLLALGVLPITMAWGGRQKELTPQLRTAGMVSAVIIGLFIYIIRLRAGVIGSGEIMLLVKILSWVVSAYMVFNSVTNLTSRSKAERLIFTPITMILAILCFVVSISRTAGFNG